MLKLKYLIVFLAVIALPLLLLGFVPLPNLLALAIALLLGFVPLPNLRAAHTTTIKSC
ncbi:MAG: hypothetical protein QNJ42_19395 [Crocosphaera sp.]|nr:hypothetical protein [Crocosphaera sp.]